jgi:hypothetical protein
MATQFIPGADCALPARAPLHPPSPEQPSRRSEGRGWGPGRVTTHLRPPPSSPRAAAAAARSSPWPGRAGREPRPLGCGMKRQPSSGEPGALYFLVLLGHQARSVGTGYAEPRAGAAPGGGVTLAHRPGGARAPWGWREPRDHRRPGRAALLRGSAARSGR